jgi:hypothetical protein
MLYSNFGGNAVEEELVHDCRRCWHVFTDQEFKDLTEKLIEGRWELGRTCPYCKGAQFIHRWTEKTATNK